MNRRQSFLAGLRTKHPAVFVAALALTLAFPAATELALRRFVFSRVPEQRFLAWTHDLWSYIPHRLGVLRESSGKQRVFLLGSSALYHSFYGEEGLKTTLRALGSPPSEVVTLHTPTQGVLESAQIVDNLPPGRGLVLLSTSPMRFRQVKSSEEAREGHLMLASPHVAGFLAAKGRSSWRLRYALAPFVNYLRLYLPLNRQTLLEGRLPRSIPFPQREQEELAARLAALPASSFPTEAEPRINSALSAMQTYWKQHEKEDREAFELLALSIQLAKAKGYEVALLETPMNPVYRAANAPQVAVLARLTRALARAEGIRYLDFTWRLGLEPEDFLDEVHLRYDREGMARFHYALAREIDEVLRPGRPFLSMGESR